MPQVRANQHGNRNPLIRLPALPSNPLLSVLLSYECFMTRARLRCEKAENAAKPHVHGNFAPQPSQHGWLTALSLHPRKDLFIGRHGLVEINERWEDLPALRLEPAVIGCLRGG